jgi:hypothetical protein
MISKDWTFKLSDTQYEKLEDWYYKVSGDKKNEWNYHGAIGGQLMFQIIPTSIGEFVTVRCEDKILDLSEV